MRALCAAGCAASLICHLVLFHILVLAARFPKARMRLRFVILLVVRIVAERRRQRYLSNLKK